MISAFGPVGSRPRFASNKPVCVAVSDHVKMFLPPGSRLCRNRTAVGHFETLKFIHDVAEEVMERIGSLSDPQNSDNPDDPDPALHELSACQFRKR